jgi:predicted O-linked N-acetylglucosamine transferase (SPINDLY family)
MQISDLWQKALHCYEIKNFQAAEEYCLQILEQDPESAHTLNLLGIIACHVSQPEWAIELLSQAIALDPQQFRFWGNLSRAYYQIKDLDNALQAIQTAITLDPSVADLYLYLGNLLQEKGDSHASLEAFKMAVTVSPDHKDSHLALIRQLIYTRQYDQAQAQCQKALEVIPQDLDLWLLLGETLAEKGEIVLAQEQFQRVFDQDPSRLRARWLAQFYLPILYNSEAEIIAWRKRYATGLATLKEALLLETPAQQRLAVQALGSRPNFYLGYQGQNDLDLQRQYGELVCRIMQTCYPDHKTATWLTPQPRIRVGYISHYLCQNTCGRLFMGWVSSYPKDRFEVYGYHFGPESDPITQYYQDHCDVFYHLPNDLNTIIQQVVADRLHILVFLDIGIHSRSTQLAGLRLAPIQCVAWAQPITTGLPTIDYFLSSYLMEPEDGDSHYSEQLIRLPHIGIYYEKPSVPSPGYSREGYNLSKDECIYLSCQSLFKYLPQYDFLYPAIAQAFPQARFLFVSHYSQQVSSQFQRRLDQAFQAYGLIGSEYYRLLPRQSWEGFMRLHLMSDVYLDTIGWSGGNTTLEAVACGLPVVTYPGSFMRGRHSYGILRRLGVTETIAQTVEDYIQIALTLGQNPDYRQQIRERIQAGHQLLYQDLTCVEALYSFFQQAIDVYQHQTCSRVE